jgi:PAS domain-containing protein
VASLTSSRRRTGSPTRTTRRSLHTTNESRHVLARLEPSLHPAGPIPTNATRRRSLAGIIRVAFKGVLAPAHARVHGRKSGPPIPQPRRRPRRRPRRHRNVKRTYENEPLREDAVAAVPDALYVVDPKGRIRFVNPVVLGIIGYENEPATGTPEPRHQPLRPPGPDTVSSRRVAASATADDGRNGPRRRGLVRSPRRISVRQDGSLCASRTRPHRSC